MKAPFLLQNGILLKCVPASASVWLKCFLLVFMLMVTCLPSHAQNTALQDSISKICDHFIEQIEAEAGQRKCAVALGSLFDAATLKPTREATRVEKLFFTTMLRHYASQTNRPLFRLRNRKPLQKASASEAYTLPPQARMLQKYGCGFLIAGRVSGSGHAPAVSAELVDLTSGMAVASSANITDMVQENKTVVEKPPASQVPASSAEDTAAQTVLPGRQEPVGTVPVAGSDMASAKGTPETLAPASAVTGELPKALAEPEQKAVPTLPAEAERGIITGTNFRYKGEIRDGKRWGTGTLVFDSGDKYTGEWKNGIKEGYGTYCYVSGDRYEGQWIGDRMHGSGIYHYSSGSRYEGAFKDGQRHGKGVFYFSNGDRWEGAYRNGKKDGKAVYIWSDGNTEPEEWKNGRKLE